MSPWSKRLAVLLAISVGLNLLLAGFWIGHRFGGRRGGPERGGPDRGAEHLTNRGPKRSSAFRGVLERHGAEFRQQRESIRAARVTARQTLTAPNFDRAALERALADLRAETAKNQEFTHRAIVEAAATSDAAQRRELARILGAGNGGEGRRR